MEAEARYTYVGAAVLALVAALVAGIVWLKNVGSRNDFHHYAIHFEHQALDGLAVGADVNLRGIKIGRVEDYALSGAKLNRVRVVVRVDRRAPVRTGTEAVITRNFVTGIAAIMLVNHDPPGGPLVEVPDGEELPVIAEGRSDLDEIAGRVNKLGEVAAVALNNLNELLSESNRHAAMAAVRNLRDLAGGLNRRLGALDQALQQVGAAAGQLGRSGERVAAVAERGGEQLERAVAEAERALADARRTMQQISASTAALQAQTSGTAQRLEATAAGVEDQLGVAVAELRSSLDAATRVMDKLREPRAALLGPGKTQLGPGERLP